MDFFARQENARQYTYRLVLLLLAAVVAVIAVTDLLVTQAAALIFDRHDLSWLFHQVLVGFMLIAILISALWRQHQLRGGGDAIAKMVDARQITPGTDDLDERRLLNVVDEMSIASGVTAPTAWVMDKEPGINAFAAGVSANQAVIVVTQGMLTQLNRDELQGIIGHEISHILNGDMLFNVRLISVLAGINVIGRAGLLLIGLVMSIPLMFQAVMGFFGFKILDFFDKKMHGWKIVIWLPVFFIVASPMLLLVVGLLYTMVMLDILGAKSIMILGALIFVVGYVGVFFGRIIRAAVSRQREFLADAASVQFTRNPDGLVSALEKIRRSEITLVGNAHADEISHLFFSQAINQNIFEGWFATHPTIEERLESISGRKPEALQKPVAIVRESAPTSVASSVSTKASHDRIDQKKFSTKTNIYKNNQKLREHWKECIAALAVVLICGGATVMLSKSVIELKYSGLKAEGRVISSGSKHLEVKYKDAFGKEHETSGAPLMFGNLERDDVVEVLYLARHPEEGRVNTWEELYMMPIVFGSFFLAFFALLILLIRNILF